MEQATFSEWEHDTKKRRTRREKFLAKRDGLIPWERLERRVERFYPKAGRGRRPYPLGTMLRVHCVQWFYNLSDPGMEDLLYEVESVRRPPPPRGQACGFASDGSATGRDDDPELPASAGASRARGDAVCGDQRASGVVGSAAEDGHDCGRKHYRRAEFDEEQAAGAGPGEAPDEEGQAMVFRQEGAHRGGLGVGLDARSGEACPREGGEQRTARMFHTRTWRCTAASPRCGGTPATRVWASALSTASGRWRGMWP